MHTNYLLPRRFKMIGWILFIPGLIAGIGYLIADLEFDLFNLDTFSIASQGILEKVQYFTMVNDNILDELIGLLIILGALFITFSKEPVEDEFISKMRLDALLWATYINYAVLILAILFLHKMVFLNVLVINMFTLLLIFIARFHWLLSKAAKLNVE